LRAWAEEKNTHQNNLIVVLQHLLKYKYQPQRRTSSWLSSIVEHRDRLEEALADSPSLRSYINEVLISATAKLGGELKQNCQLTLFQMSRHSPLRKCLMLIICLTKVANNYTSLARCLGKIFKIDLGFRALRSLGCTVPF